MSFVTKRQDGDKVAVLVATYNGEPYIKQQLDSILRQKDIAQYDYQIFVYDDGSKDRTLKILKEYGSSIHIVPKDEKYQGVKSAIYSLLSKVQADYYYFSDQDDVWEPDKIQRTQLLWERFDSTIPGGVYSDLLLVDGKNRSLRNTMMSVNGWSKTERRDLSFLIFDPRVTGAALSINRAARDFVLQMSKREFLNVTMHDAFFALIISAFDNLAFLPKPLVRYRQHGNNQIGARRTLSQRLNIIHRISSLKNRLADILILGQLAQSLPFSVRDELKVFSEFAICRNPFKRVAIVVRNRKYWKNTSTIKLLLIIVSGVSVRRK